MRRDASRFACSDERFRPSRCDASPPAGRTRDGGGINSTHLPGFVGPPGATRPSLLITVVLANVSLNKHQPGYRKPSNANPGEQFRREAGDGTAAAAATGEHLGATRRDSVPAFISSFAVKLRKPPIMSGWKREEISFRTSQASHFQLGFLQASLRYLRVVLQRVGMVARQEAHFTVGHPGHEGRADRRRCVATRGGEVVNDWERSS